MGEDSEGSLEVAGFHTTDFLTTLITIILFILGTTAGRIVFHLFEIRFIPESALVILAGVAFGGILAAGGVSESSVLTFNEEVFFLVLIPPIILAAGYFLKATFFFHNFWLILVYAIFGTLLNVAFVGIGLWAVSTTDIFKVEMETADIFTFASLIAAVDPVAVLAVFEEVHVNETLNILVFGESILNDAVSIVLYRLFVSLREIDFTPSIPFLAITKFFVVSFLGVIIGALCALFSAFLTRFTSHIRIVEPLIALLFGILSYLLAETIEVSGIVAILFCGMIQNRYVEQNISEKSHVALNYALRILSSTAETVIFIYLGVSTVYHLKNTNNEFTKFDIPFIVFTMIFIISARFIIVYLLTILANTRRLEPIGRKSQFVLAYGGLRGAIAFALAFTIPNDMPAKNVLITTTLFVIWFTIFIQGTTIKPIIRFFQIRLEEEGDESIKTAQTVLPKSFEHLTEAISVITEGVHTGWFGTKQVWRSIDKFITRLTVRESYQEEKQLISSIRRLKNLEQKGGSPQELQQQKEKIKKLAVSANVVNNSSRRKMSTAQKSADYPLSLFDQVSETKKGKMPEYGQFRMARDEEDESMRNRSLSRTSTSEFVFYESEDEKME